MSVRRNNENAVGTRRPLGPAHGPIKPMTSKPLASKENQRTVLGKSVNVSTRPSASATDKPVKPTAKPGAAPRRALSSLTNGTPQATRQPLTSKPSKQAAQTPLANRTLSTKTPQITRTSAPSKTSANARSVKKTLSVYTPAQDKYLDNVEYMPPLQAERSYAPHSALVASGADDDVFAPDMPSGPMLTFEAADEQHVPRSLIDSPGGLDNFCFDP